MKYSLYPIRHTNHPLVLFMLIVFPVVLSSCVTRPMDMNTRTYIYDITITSEPSGAAVFAKPLKSSHRGDSFYENLAYEMYGSLDEVLIGHTPFRAELWCEATPTSPYGYVKTKWSTNKGNNTSDASAMVGLHQKMNSPTLMHSQTLDIFYVLRKPGYQYDFGDAGGTLCGTFMDTLYKFNVNPYNRHHVLIPGK